MNKKFGYTSLEIITNEDSRAIHNGRSSYYIEGIVSSALFF